MVGSCASVENFGKGGVNILYCWTFLINATSTDHMHFV